MAEYKWIDKEVYQEKPDIEQKYKIMAQDLNYLKNLIDKNIEALKAIPLSIDNLIKDFDKKIKESAESTMELLKGFIEEGVGPLFSFVDVVMNDSLQPKQDSFKNTNKFKIKWLDTQQISLAIKFAGETIEGLNNNFINVEIYRTQLMKYVKFCIASFYTSTNQIFIYLQMDEQDNIEITSSENWKVEECFITLKRW